MPLGLLVFVVCASWALYLFSFRRKRRYRKVLEIRRARQEERVFGEHFLEIALDKQQEIKCLVYARHFRWPNGYEIWLTWLGEPDTIVAVKVNYSLSPKRRIEIRQWPCRDFFSLDRDSLDQATREFEKRLTNLICVTV